MDQFFSRLFEFENTLYSRINDKLIDFISISKVMKSIGQLLKSSYFTSVDITEIYLGQINIIRYIINWIHFILINFCAILMVSFISNDSLYSLVDNEFMPKNTRLLLVVALVFMLLTISFRFDVLIDEWRNHLIGFKFLYYLQENVDLKHGLTSTNHFKLSILAKLMEIGLKLGTVQNIKYEMPTVKD